MRAWATASAVALAASALSMGVAWLAGGPSLGGVPAAVGLAALALGVQWVAFVPAAWWRTERFYDGVGSLTYLALVGAAVGLATLLGGPTWRGLAFALAVSAWAVRLGGFLVARAHREGDGRFDAIKRSPPRFFVAWTLQGTWVWLTAVAAIHGILALHARPLHGVELLGALVWASGFAVEVVLDACRGIAADTTAAALDELRAAGVQLT